MVDLAAPAGARLHAAPGTADPCRACAHNHRVTVCNKGITVTYVQACPCGCVASGAVYGPDMGNISRAVDSKPKIAKSGDRCVCAATGTDNPAIVHRTDGPCYVDLGRVYHRLDTDGRGTDLGSASLRLHPLPGEPDNTDGREPDIRGQRLVPVQRHDVAGERWRPVRVGGSVRHGARAEHGGRVDLRRLGVLAMGWGHKLLGWVRDA